MWVQKDRNATMPESMFNVLQGKDPTEWTILEINEHVSTRGEFNSGRVRYILKNNTTLDTLDTLDSSTNTGTRTTKDGTEVTSTQGIGKELANLAKMYTEDNKYSGENDNFDFKLVIFHDLCDRADVPQETRIKAYPTMLRGLALDHFYTSLKNVA